MDMLYDHAADALHAAFTNFKQQIAEKGAIEDYEPMQVHCSAAFYCTRFRFFSPKA